MYKGAKKGGLKKYASVCVHLISTENRLNHVIHIQPIDVLLAGLYNHVILRSGFLITFDDEGSQ